MTKVAIVGSREYQKPDQIRDFVNALPDNTTIVSGGAKGVDKIAEQTANLRGLETIIYKADWNTYGKIAGVLRNTTIVENSDQVVAFWDGKSRGTRDTINKAIHSDNISQITIYKENT